MAHARIPRARQSVASHSRSVPSAPATFVHGRAPPGSLPCHRCIVHEPEQDSRSHSRGVETTERSGRSGVAFAARHSIDHRSRSNDRRVMHVGRRGLVPTRCVLHQTGTLPAWTLPVRSALPLLMPTVDAAADGVVRADGPGPLPRKEAAECGCRMFHVRPDQQQNFFSSVTVLSVGRFGGGRCWDSVAIGRGLRPPFRSPPKTPMGVL